MDSTDPSPNCGWRTRQPTGMLAGDSVCTPSHELMKHSRQDKGDMHREYPSAEQHSNANQQEPQVSTSRNNPRKYDRDVDSEQQQDPQRRDSRFSGLKAQPLLEERLENRRLKSNQTHQQNQAQNPRRAESATRTVGILRLSTPVFRDLMPLINGWVHYGCSARQWRVSCLPCGGPWFERRLRVREPTTSHTRTLHVSRRPRTCSLRRRSQSLDRPPHPLVHHLPFTKSAPAARTRQSASSSPRVGSGRGFSCVGRCG